MTAGGATKSQVLWRGFAGLLGVTAGLCTIFAFVVTAAEAWQEHSQAQWPVVTAHVEKCAVDPISFGRRDQYYIDCILRYRVGDGEFVTKVYSRQVAQRVIWQSSPVNVGTLQEWTDAHPQGTPIAVRYNPANRNKAVLAVDDMPFGGPHTPSNLKLLGFFAASSVLLLTIARITRLRSDALAAAANG